MTATETLTSLIGETAASLLPADDAWALVEGGTDDVLPEVGSVAVGCRAGDHVIAVVASPEMARRILAGPPPADGVLDGLAPAVAAIASVLGAGEPGPLAELDAASTARDLPAHSLVARLLDGEAHLVTVLVTPPLAEDPAEDRPPRATFSPLGAAGPAAPAPSGLEVLHEVEMGVTAELGRTRMPLRDILQLVPGSVIELDRAASSPVDVVVNGTLIARGEVVVIDEEFGIRITEVVGHQTRGRGGEAPQA